MLAEGGDSGTCKLLLQYLVLPKRIYRPLEQCFSTFVRPRPGKLFFFIRRGSGPNKFTRKRPFVGLTAQLP